MSRAKASLRLFDRLLHARTALSSSSREHAVLLPMIARRQLASQRERRLLHWSMSRTVSQTREAASRVSAYSFACAS